MKAIRWVPSGLLIFALAAILLGSGVVAEAALLLYAGWGFVEYYLLRLLGANGVAKEKRLPHGGPLRFMWALAWPLIARWWQVRP